MCMVLAPTPQPAPFTPLLYSIQYTPRYSPFTPLNPRCTPLNPSQPLCVKCRDETHSAKMFSKHDIVDILSKRLNKQRFCSLHDEPFIMYNAEDKVTVTGYTMYLQLCSWCQNLIRENYCEIIPYFLQNRESGYQHNKVHLQYNYIVKQLIIDDLLPRQSLVCISCFREIGLSKRTHCLDIESAYSSVQSALCKSIEYTTTTQGALHELLGTLDTMIAGVDNTSKKVNTFKVSEEMLNLLNNLLLSPVIWFTIILFYCNCIAQMQESKTDQIN